MIRITAGFVLTEEDISFIILQDHPEPVQAILLGNSDFLARYRLAEPWLKGHGNRVLLILFKLAKAIIPNEFRLKGKFPGILFSHK